MAARRSQTSRHAAPDLTSLPSTRPGPFRRGVPAFASMARSLRAGIPGSPPCPRAKDSAACPSPTLRHEDPGRLGRHLDVDDDLTRRLALAAFLPGEARVDVDGDAVGRRTLQRR